MCFVCFAISRNRLWAGWSKEMKFDKSIAFLFETFSWELVWSQHFYDPLEKTLCASDKCIYLTHANLGAVSKHHGEVEHSLLKEVILPSVAHQSVDRGIMEAQIVCVWCCCCFGGGSLPLAMVLFSSLVHREVIVSFCTLAQKPPH